MDILPFITEQLDVHLLPHTITRMIKRRILGKLEQMEKNFPMEILRILVLMLFDVVRTIARMGGHLTNC